MINKSPYSDEDTTPKSPIIRPPPNFQDSENPFEKDIKNEGIKKQATQKQDDNYLVDQLVKSSNRNIISISSLLSFFPTTINVEETRITFTFRQLFSSQSHSLDIKDISNVFIESSLFSASLQIVSRTYIQNDIKIGNLPKNKAIKVRMIIEGLRMFASRNISTSNYQVNELVAKIEEMHSSQGGQLH